jgi:hypothetical protein
MVRDGKELVQARDLETDEGIWQFDSAGANRSLELLGKHLGLFVEKVEHAGVGGGPIVVRVDRDG